VDEEPLSAHDSTLTGDDEIAPRTTVCCPWAAVRHLRNTNHRPRSKDHRLETMKMGTRTSIRHPWTTNRCPWMTDRCPRTTEMGRAR